MSREERSRAFSFGSEESFIGHNRNHFQQFYGNVPMAEPTPIVSGNIGAAENVLDGLSYYLVDQV